MMLCRRYACIESDVIRLFSKFWHLGLEYATFAVITQTCDEAVCMVQYYRFVITNYQCLQM